MRALLDTSHDLIECSQEIGCIVEQLFTPLTRFLPQYPDEPFGVDNGAYSKFCKEAFLALLEREYHRRHLCRFVAVPDVVGSARRTLECFDHWRYKLSGWPLALVIQDGQEDLDIPWGGIHAVFIGGSTEWKISKSAGDVVRAAKILGKWVHVGRINTRSRFEHFEKLGADSFDGSGTARYSWMRERIRDGDQPTLFQDTPEEPVYQ